MAEKQEKSNLDEAARPSFGQNLRREREMREVSIREISETTKISTRFLQAIEQGDYSSLPAPVFTRGFIREYASYLGLNPEEIVDQYMAAVAQQEREREHEEAEMRERISGKFPIVPGAAMKWILLAFGAIVILGLVIFLISRMGASEEPRAERAGEQAPVTPPRPLPETGAARAERIEMTLKAIADTWVDLQVDGEEPTDFILQTGQTRDLEARERIVLRTVGNAGGVQVILNGVELEPLGAEGDVVRNVDYDLAMVNDLLDRRRAPGAGE